MARPSKEPPCTSALVPALLRFARTSGEDVALLAERCGLSAEAENADEALAPPLAAGAILEVLAAACGEAAIGLRLASDLPVRRYGFGDLAARASATVGDALVRLARYAPLLHAAVEASFDLSADEGRWTLRTPGHPRGLGRHFHEFVIGNVVAQCRAGASAPVRIARVWFAHSRPAGIGPITSFFGTDSVDVAFGCEHSGFCLPRAALDVTMRERDERMVATVEPLAEAALHARSAERPDASLASRVDALVAGGLPALLDVDEAARLLHLSGRTLQRRLEEEGTRYTDRVEGVRRAEAERLLADPSVSLSSVAARVGFADLASFSRGFKRWTGVAPGQWRHGRRRP